jgi:hypothetical protein
MRHGTLAWIARPTSVQRPAFRTEASYRRNLDERIESVGSGCVRDPTEPLFWEPVCPQ